jgi:signal transduction histidine kinase
LAQAAALTPKCALAVGGRRMPVLDLIHADDQQQVLSTWHATQAESAAAGGRAMPCMFTCRQRRKDGTYIWCQSASCITPTHFYGVMRDINDRKALEARTRNTKHVHTSARIMSDAHITRFHLDAQSSLKDFLISTMADMRQPLTGLSAASELLAQQPCVRDDEEATFLVAAISAASRMLSGIVANVLSLRSLEAGDCTIAAAPFSVRDMVDGVLAVCRMSLAHRAGARITWRDEHAPLPPLVCGDADRLAQIALNLLTSARPQAFRLHLHRHRARAPLTHTVVFLARQMP